MVLWGDPWVPNLVQFFWIFIFIYLFIKFLFSVMFYQFFIFILLYSVFFKQEKSNYPLQRHLLWLNTSPTFSLTQVKRNVIIGNKTGISVASRVVKRLKKILGLVASFTLCKGILRTQSNTYDGAILRH